MAKRSFSKKKVPFSIEKEALMLFYLFITPYLLPIIFIFVFLFYNEACIHNRRIQMNSDNEQLKPLTPSNNNNLLIDLRLKSRAINNMLKYLIPSELSLVHYDSGVTSITVQLVEFKKGQYFARILCGAFAHVDNKERLIKEAVEYALAEKKLTLDFESIGVGGVIGSKGRIGSVVEFFGITPSSAHAYCLFKLPGEHQVYIEDARTNVFSSVHKLQSRFDDQVCSFSATALFYFCYKYYITAPTTFEDSRMLFREIYEIEGLRETIVTLESKVNKVIQTKKEVMQDFISDIQSIENVLFEKDNSDSLSMGKLR